MSLFVSGCRNHCKGCFNPETWSFNYGQPFTYETMSDILEGLSKWWVSGFSLLGGDPFEPGNQPTVVDILRQIRTYFPATNVWCYAIFVEIDVYC